MAYIATCPYCKLRPLRDYPKKRYTVKTCGDEVCKKKRAEITTKIWQKNNPDKRLQISQNYYKNNREKCIQMAKDWAKANKEKLIEYNKQYNKDNKEKIATQKRNYYILNKDRICAKQKERYMKKRQGKWQNLDFSKGKSVRVNSDATGLEVFNPEEEKNETKTPE